MVLIRFSRELTLPVLCLASLSRSIVGVAGGATKAAVAQHQVRGIHFTITFSKTYYLKLVVNKILAYDINIFYSTIFSHIIKILLNFTAV